VLKSVVKFLKSHGYTSYICGGTARDLKLKKTLKYYDIAVKSTLSELQASFKDKIIATDPFSTSVTIKYMDSEFTLYPMKKVWLENSYYKFEYTGSLKEDAESRDFTINALYYDPLGNKWYDFFNGEKDLNDKIIRFIGNPHSKILESKVRVLRGPVLAGMLGTGWSLETRTNEAIKDYRLKLALAHSAQVYKEINKIFTRVEVPSKVFNILRSAKVLDDFFPELALCVGIPQSNKRKNLDLFQHIMYALDSVKLSHPRCSIIRAAALLHDIGKPQCQTNINDNLHFYGHEKAGAFLTERILFRWGFKKDFIKRISALISLHLFDASKKISDLSVRKLINKAGPDNIHNLLDLRIADRYGTGRPNISMEKVEFLRKRVNQQLEKISPNDFKLNLSDKEILKLVDDHTDDPRGTLLNVKHFLKNKILYDSINNKSQNLKRIIRNTIKINCPLGAPHFFNTQIQVQENRSESFEDGKLKCGVFCNFVCDKKLRT
jgi:tRNA nucleotidyltransferase (CCA-adding enzyme)